MMSGDGFRGKNNAIDQVVTKKLGGKKEKCIILYCNLNIVWNIWREILFIFLNPIFFIFLKISIHMFTSLSMKLLLYPIILVPYAIKSSSNYLDFLTCALQSLTPLWKWKILCNPDFEEPIDVALNNRYSSSQPFFLLTHNRPIHLDFLFRMREVRK